MNTSYSITSKYQVTLPKQIREKIGIGKDDRVTFIEDGDRVYLQRIETVEEVAARTQEIFKKSGLQPATQKDIDGARQKFMKENMKW
ncbi:MAG: AbrB/MazE/SpoVT family DNA-binding domain-containing protein [Candidatus Saccharimonadales bacterium]